MFKNKNFLKIIVLLATISLVATGPAFARGRRGGNSSGDLAVAAISGAAMAAGPVLGASFSGAEAGTAVYQASLASGSSAAVAGSVTSAGLTAAEVHPDTARWISAGVGGLAGGAGYVDSYNAASSAAFPNAGSYIAGRVAGSVVGAEVAHQVDPEGGFLAMVAGSAANSFTSGFTQGMLSSDTNSYKEYRANGGVTKDGQSFGPVNEAWYEQNVTQQQIAYNNAITNYDNPFTSGLSQYGVYDNSVTPVALAAPGTLEYAFNKGVGRALGSNYSNLADNLVSSAVYSGVDHYLQKNLSERSPARAYSGRISSLASNVAGHLAETQITGEPNIFSPEHYKAKSSGWVADYQQDEQGRWTRDATAYRGKESIQTQGADFDFDTYRNTQEAEGRQFTYRDNTWREYRSLDELNGSAAYRNERLNDFSPSVQPQKMYEPDLSNIYREWE